MVNYGHGDVRDVADEDCVAAADRIDALEADNKALREALRPFAELGGAWLAVDEHDNSIWVASPDSTPVNNLTNFGFTFGNFRAAARALLAKEAGE